MFMGGQVHSRLININLWPNKGPPFKDGSITSILYYLSLNGLHLFLEHLNNLKFTKNTGTWVSGSSWLFRHTCVCGYCAIPAYMQLRLNSQMMLHDPALFIYNNGTVLEHKSFAKFTKLVIKQLGLNMALFSAHSQRARSAPIARSQSLGDWEAQPLGWWQLEVHGIYILQPKLYQASFVFRSS